MKKIFLFLFFVIFFTLPAFSITENYEKIDLKRAIELAKENNPDIKSLKSELLISKNEIKIANRLQNPSINFLYNFGKAGEGNPEQLGATEVIELFKRAPRKKLNAAYYELSKIDTAFEENQIKFEIRKAYVLFSYKKTLLSLLLNEREFLEKELEFINKQTSSDKKFEADIVQLKMALNKTNAEINIKQKEMKDAFLGFNLILNIKDKYDIKDDNLFIKNSILDIKIPKSGDKMPLGQDIIENLAQNTYEVKEALAKIDIAKKNLSVVSRQRIPDLEIEAGWAFQGKKTSDDGTFQNGAYLSTKLLDIPVLYAFRPEVKNAELKIEAANLNYLSALNKNVRIIEREYEQFKTSTENLDYYDEGLLSDEKALFELSRKEYEAGKTGLNSLFEAKNSYRDFMYSYAQTIYEYYTSWLDFLSAVNSDEIDL